MPSTTANLIVALQTDIDLSALQAAKDALDKYDAWHTAVAQSHSDTPEQFMDRVRLLSSARAAAVAALAQIEHSSHYRKITQP